MRDTSKVMLTFFGSIVFCAAVVGTIQSLMQGGLGNGPSIGGIVIGVGLAMLVMPWLRDDRHAERPQVNHKHEADALRRKITAA